jgi:Zn-dependent M28 family amino/carboxypeptidase
MTLKLHWAGWRVAAALLASASFCPVANADTIGAAALAPRQIEPATDEGAFRHLRALQDIATANGGNRAAGTSGYDRSADYVAQTLRDAGYSVRFEEFEFPFFEDRTPPVLAANNADGTPEAASTGGVRTLRNSGSGDVTAPVRAVNLGLGDGAPAASTSGCGAADFAAFERGTVALIRRGTCPFQVKVDNAVAAGAVGAVIMNEGGDGKNDVFSGLLTKPVAIPVVGISYERGRSLAARADATVHVVVDAVSGKRTTRNVLAETTGDGPWIIVGAHLDGVPEGPGINDNGSGSAAVLEAAVRLARQPIEAATGARLRYAFWGAEERGLVGSRHHVGAMSEDERRNVALYVNLDMVGSPNFVRVVQGSAAADGPAALARSVLDAEFREHGLPFEERSGGRTRTDDASFSDKGIPTVGLYTGAGAAKTEAQATTFGGAAGRAYDPCYHQACDTIDNINREVLEEITRALVRVIDAVAKAAPRPATPAEGAGNPPESR